MRTTLLVGALIAVGCADTEPLEKRIGELEKVVATSQEERASIQRKLDVLVSELAEVRDLARKAEEMSKRPDPVRPSYPRRNEPDRAKTYAVPIDGAHVEGRPDAKVTMVWGYEYACPYCEKVRPTIAELRQKYGNDLRVVYTHLVVHPATATASALAACAAAKQGKFSRMDEALWEKSFKQRRFDRTGCERDPDGCPVMNELARGAGLDVRKFQRDMADCEQPIKARQAELQKFGANATPSFFINGRYTSGAQPASSFEALIDEELKKANERIQQGASQQGYYEEWVLLNGEKMLAP